MEKNLLTAPSAVVLRHGEAQEIINCIRQIPALAEAVAALQRKVDMLELRNRGLRREHSPTINITNIVGNDSPAQKKFLKCPKCGSHHIRCVSQQTSDNFVSSHTQDALWQCYDCWHKDRADGFHFIVK